MTTNQTTCAIIETSPRAADWQRIFGRLDNIPLTSSRLNLVRHQTEGLMYVYGLDLSALTPDERERLIDFLAEKFNLPRAEVAGDIDEQGVPVRAEDALVNSPSGVVAPLWALSGLALDVEEFLKSSKPRGDAQLDDELVDWQDDDCGWDGEEDDDDI